MSQDRRISERLSFHMNECRGMFVLESPDDEFEIDDIHDISLNGMGFDLPFYLDPEMAVSVTYEEEQISVTIHGTVIWCEDHPEIHGTFRVGIQFDYADLDESSQLLLAVERYTDTPGPESWSSRLSEK